MNGNFEFKIYNDVRNIKDSMELDSGTTICRLFKDGNEIVIRVCGLVKVFWYPNVESDEHEVFKYPSDFPKELKELFRNGDAYEDNRVGVWENNWFEVFYNEYESNWESDVVDVSGYDENQLLKLCLDYLDIFSKEK